MPLLKQTELYKETPDRGTKEYISNPTFCSSFEDPCFSLTIDQRDEKFFQDIKIIERSFAELAERKRNFKRKSSNKPTLENIQEEDSTVVEVKLSSEESMVVRDFSAIHRERALSCGSFSPNLNEARRFRQKKLSSIYRSRYNST